jgi:hypothetical protein
MRFLKILHYIQFSTSLYDVSNVIIQCINHFNWFFSLNHHQDSFNEIEDLLFSIILQDMQIDINKNTKISTICQTDTNIFKLYWVSIYEISELIFKL